MGTMATPVQGLFSPLVCELLALKASINFGLDANILLVEIEIDCKKVARLLSTDEPSWA